MYNPLDIVGENGPFMGTQTHPQVWNGDSKVEAKYQLNTKI